MILLSTGFVTLLLSGLYEDVLWGALPRHDKPLARLFRLLSLEGDTDNSSLLVLLSSPHLDVDLVSPARQDFRIA